MKKYSKCGLKCLSMLMAPSIEVAFEEKDTAAKKAISTKDIEVQKI